MISSFSCVAPGMKKYSLDLPRAVKNREYALEMEMDYLDCECVECVILA